MKMYNVWLFLILLAVLTANNKLDANTRQLRRQNDLLEHVLRQRLHPDSTSVPASVRAYLRHRPGTPLSMAGCMLELYRRHPELLLTRHAR